jgi:phospholipid/cholesterol/gamma-HCH transport system ATP-binding protein
MKRPDIESVAFHNLTFVNGSGREVFSNLSFEFPMNQIVWLRDETGATKASLMRILTGLSAPTSGDYLVNGAQVNEMTFEEFVPYRCNMGYSFEFGGLINNRDILNNLMLGLEYHKADLSKPNQLAEHVEALMSIFDLKPVAHERPSAIAGGFRKAAIIARALIHQPEWLLLEDPTTGLRSDVKARLKELLLRGHAGGKFKHIFITSEDAAFMNDLNPAIVELGAGGLSLIRKGRAA